MPNGNDRDDDKDRDGGGEDDNDNDDNNDERERASIKYNQSINQSMHYSTFQWQLLVDSTYKS